MPDGLRSSVAWCLQEPSWASRDVVRSRSLALMPLMQRNSRPEKRTCRAPCRCPSIASMPAQTTARRRSSEGKGSAPVARVLYEYPRRCASVSPYRWRPAFLAAMAAVRGHSGFLSSRSSRSSPSSSPTPYGRPWSKRTPCCPAECQAHTQSPLSAGRLAGPRPRDRPVWRWVPAPGGSVEAADG